MARTDRQKLDVLFGEVYKLFYHTIRCGPCLGKSRFNTKEHQAWLVGEIEKLYNCLDEPVSGEGE